MADNNRIGPISRRRVLASSIALAGMASIDETWANQRAAAGQPSIDRSTGTADCSVAPRLSPIVDTSNGKVRGYVEDGIHTFRGLRYGAPTGGVNRFRPPATPAPWTGVMHGYVAAGGNVAPQLTADSSSPNRWTNALDPDGPPMSEDCLFLNLFTPGVNDNVRRPVMVWLHGGAWARGSGVEPAFDGTRLARRGDSVIITINHRLNLFAYLYLADLLGAEYADSGNAGALDIIAALQWIKENVANFGGDPGNVTLFGWSSGGADVCQLLAMPAADGLFHKAIIQSGAQLTLRTREEAARAAEQTLGRLGLNRARAREILVLSMEAVLAGGGGGAPTVDGRSVPRQLWEPDAPPTARKVPILVGGTDSELSMVASDDVFDADDRGMTRRLERLLGDLAGPVLAGYREGYPNATPGQLLILVATGLWTTKRSTQLAERKAAQGGAPVYSYRWRWRPPFDDGKYLSPHGVDLPFVWDNVETSRDRVGTGSGQQRLADDMSDRWLAFARDGDPNARDLVRWEPYTLAHRATLVIDRDDAVIDDPYQAERLALASIPQSAISGAFSLLRG